MKPGWWWLLVIPVAFVAVFEPAGDWLFGVRVARPAPPAAPPAEDTNEQVQQAFARWPGPGPDPAEPELVAFLRTVAASAKAGQALETADAFDTTRLYDEVARSDVFARAGLRPNPTSGPRQLRIALWDAVHDTGLGLAFDHVEVRKVVRLPAGEERMVYARQRAGGRSVAYRWWLVRTSLGWKAYDLEDLRVGLRLSHQAVQLAAHSGDGEVPAQLLAGLKALQAASDRLNAGQADAADAALAPARAASLPREPFVLRCVLEGAVAAIRGRSAEALEWADRVDAVAPGLPAVDYLRASAYAAAGRWPQAARHARKYLDLLGPDAAACRILGAALAEMGQPAEAAEAFEQGLRDDPGREDLRAALRGLRPRR